GSGVAVATLSTWVLQKDVQMFTAADTHIPQLQNQPQHLDTHRIAETAARASTDGSAETCEQIVAGCDWLFNGHPDGSVDWTITVVSSALVVLRIGMI
ncbi:hypothetical protein KUCAC02_006467, partial [Chaenocephalus aceratus]